VINPENLQGEVVRIELKGAGLSDCVGKGDSNGRTEEAAGKYI